MTVWQALALAFPVVVAGGAVLTAYVAKRVWIDGRKTTPAGTVVGGEDEVYSPRPAGQDLIAAMRQAREALENLEALAQADARGRRRRPDPNIIASSPGGSH